MTKEERQSLHVIIHRALEEDLGDGDITTLSTVPGRSKFKGTFIAKDTGIIAGLEVVRETLKYLDPRILFSSRVEDGQRVTRGTVLATVRGNGRALLIAERTALNFFQRMSGIATTTRRYVDAVRKTKAIIVDTRKTAPGLRLLDKWAVRLGGGQNHRFGLYDMVLIKENHIAAAGGITLAVSRVRAADRLKRPIEVEVRNLKELRETLELNVDRILLDNMSPEQMHKAVRMTKGKTALEASGNVSLENVAAVAATGVDIISVGKLTHSVRALDISFLIE
ncbi:MAG: carboxylating nicotinate-nucleotide diphosphorylase [Ignavibacteriae bacterium]|nr:MAG: carboxylating nicotinate-nucleotide diphosphorylase [Ignavibacteriota bacterium]